jgi:hypothetical protein
LWVEDVPGAEIDHRLSAQYGNITLPQQSMYKWMMMFKNGPTGVTDEEQ